jgi:hypothetical protein
VVPGSIAATVALYSPGIVMFNFSSDVLICFGCNGFGTVDSRVSLGFVGGTASSRIEPSVMLWRRRVPRWWGRLVSLQKRRGA